MKKSLSILLCLFVLGQLSGQGIEFYHGSWKDAFAEAKKQDKIIFVDAYAKWCGPCKRMARDVFTKSNVGEFFNDNFINLKLDMEIPDGHSFGKKYPVSAYPTLFFIDSNGEILTKVVGGQSAGGLIEIGKNAIKSFDRSGNYEEKYEAGDRSFNLMYEYVAALNQVDKPSLKISNDFWKSDHGMSDSEQALFLMEAVQEADSKLFDALVERKKQAIKSTSKEEFEDLIERAALATVNKAVEFDYEELLHEAINQYNSASIGNENKFKSFAHLEYYKLTGNYKSWKSESQTFLKKYGKKDAGIYKQQIQTLRNELKYHEDALSYASELAKELVKKDDSKENSFFYIQLLLEKKDYTEARKQVEIAIKNAKSRKEDSTQFDRIKAYLDTI